MKTNKVLTFGAAILFAATVWGQSAIKKHSQTPLQEKQTQLANACGVTADFNHSNTTCAGNAVYFYDSTSVTQGQQIVQLTWDFGDSSVVFPDTLPNVAHVFNAPGTYNVQLIVESNTGCIDTITKSITVGAIQLNINGVNVTTTGGNDGSVYVNISQGTAPFNYQWSNGASVNIATPFDSITGLTAGCYSVTVVDANGCMASAGTCITQPSTGCDLTVNAQVVSNASCFGCNNGSAQAIATSSAGGISYSWNNGTLTQTATGLAAGCYTVMVIDGNMCSDTTAVCITQPQQGGCNMNVIIANSNNVSTNGGADGSASVGVTGGTPPYTYSWNNGTTTATATGLSAGCYTVFVYDSQSCMVGTGVCITQPQDSLCNLSAIISSSTNVCCFGYADGSATVSASAGTGSYLYSWNNGSTAQTNTGLAAGCYTVVVSDQNNCTASASVCITQPQDTTSVPATLNVTAENFNAISYCDTNNTTSSGYAWVTNGTPPYTYLWNNGSTNWSLSGLSVGCYSVVVTDANGATGTASKCVVQSTPIQFTPVVKNVNCFDSLSGEISLSGFTGGAAPFLISATNATDSINAAWGTTVIPNLPEGTYNVTVNDANGCQVTQQTTIIKANCDVWPGDANADLVANNYDLLPIGLGFGDTGPTRSGATTNWVAQACTDWTNNQVSGANYKHADCNGDGTIDSTDASVILINYGQTHNKNNYSLPAGPNDPTLAIVIPQDSAVGGSTVTGNIMLGTQAIPANVYGIAFSLEYDASIVKQGTVIADFSSNWIGNSSNTLTIQKDVYGNGKIDIAITRTDKQNISGSGSIGTVSFILKDDVSGKDIVYNQLNITPINLVMIGNDGVQIPANLTGDSIIGSTDVTGVENIVRSSSNLIVYPNPASDVINVTAGGETMEWIRITNLVGEIVYQSNDQVSKATINTTELSAGTYYLQVKSNSGISVKPIVINH